MSLQLLLNPVSPHYSPSSVCTPINTPTQPTHRKPLSHSLLLCLVTNKGNGRRQAELPEESHAQQLCQPANGRADWTAGDLYTWRPSNQRKAVHRKEVHSEGVNCQRQSRKKLCKTASRECEQRLAARSRRLVNSAFPCNSEELLASIAPTTLCRGLPWSSV